MIGLPESLKSKVVKDVFVNIPEIMLIFEDGTSLMCEFKDYISNRTPGDERGVKIRVRNESGIIVYENELKQKFAEGKWGTVFAKRKDS